MSEPFLRSNRIAALFLYSFVLTVLFCLIGGVPAQAHDTPFSYADLRLSDAGIEMKLEAPAADFAHYLPKIEPKTLLTAAGATANQAAMFAQIQKGFRLKADGQELTGSVQSVVPEVENRLDYVRFQLRYEWKEKPETLGIGAHFFPYDPRHKTYVNIYEGERLAKQLIFEGQTQTAEFVIGSGQSTLQVIRQFTAEGIHHIFIGPDHILFIIALLLLGGSLGQLLKIVTAFTVAHSITLGLATFDLLSPPSRLIESTIALSIVCVGVHDLLHRNDTPDTKRRDYRMAFAFCFGLIHGFGFASVLKELELPRQALGWSLFSFNVGVELGQMCIVLLVSPLLALLQQKNEKFARNVVTVAALVVIAAGGFWFVQRLFST